MHLPHVMPMLVEPLASVREGDYPTTFDPATAEDLVAGVQVVATTVVPWG